MSGLRAIHLSQQQSYNNANRPATRLNPCEYNTNNQVENAARAKKYIMLNNGCLPAGPLVAYYQYHDACMYIFFNKSVCFYKYTYKYVCIHM